VIPRRRRRRFFWLIAYTLLAVLAFGLTVATLGLPSTAHTSAEGAHLGFGYPISFVWAEKTVLSASAYPQTYRFNPWSEPQAVEVSGRRLVADWFLVTAVFWAALWFLRRSFTSSRTLPSPG
jgi:hypothetical protein